MQPYLTSLRRYGSAKAKKCLFESNRDNLLPAILQTPAIIHH